jgi:hypothetical protein
MPIISRETVGVVCPNSGPMGFVKYVKVLKYVTKQQQFVIALPEWVKEALGVGFVCGKTQEEVEKFFKKVCQDYTDSLKKIRKVIVYIVEMNGTVWGGEGKMHMSLKGGIKLALPNQILYLV